ncbi:hypothetical protein DMJ13_17825 [halophilic archaeon]|nr:hypothetical protein DMJ13_17825 [halophilic archaeon]
MALVELQVTDDAIDPQHLDKATLEVVKYAVQDFAFAEPDKPYMELNVYQQGRYDAYTSVLEMLTQWTEEMDTQNKG